jgi:hypothetical protein
MQSPKSCVFKQKQDRVLDKSRTIDNNNNNNNNNLIHKIKCDGNKFKGIPEINRTIQMSHTY